MSNEELANLLKELDSKAKFLYLLLNLKNKLLIVAAFKVATNYKKEKQNVRLHLGNETYH